MTLDKRPIWVHGFDDLMGPLHWDDYGFTAQEIAPNLHRFRQRGLDAKRAVAPAPTCMAARFAVMAGVHPLASGILTSNPDRTVASSMVPLDGRWIQRRLREFGFTSIESYGKVFHESPDHEPAPDVFDLVVPPPWHARSHGGGVPGLRYGPSLDVQPDRLLADMLGPRLAALRDGEAVFSGFRAPHVPLTPPAEYFDRFPLDRIVLPTQVPRPTGVAGAFFLKAPAVAEIKALGQERNLIQAYLAATNYADELFGELLERVAPATRVVVWSDHGYTLLERSAGKGQTHGQVGLVPLFVQADDRHERGGDIRHPVSTTRIWELIIALVARHPDLPLLDTTPDDVAICAFETPDRRVQARSVVGNEYTLVKHWNDQGDEATELYHRADVEELSDLSGDQAYSDEVAALEARLGLP